MVRLRRRPTGRGGPPKGIPPTPIHRDWTRIVCVASGPSFSMEQAKMLRSVDLLGWRVMVANNSWERLPDADLLYAGDCSWWQMHYDRVIAGFRGECWTQDRWFAHRHGLHHVRHSDELGLSRAPNLVFSGGNSGHVLLNLAYLFGGRLILLVGYDMQDTDGMSHWHGDHPAPLNPLRNYPHWIAAMNSMAPELAKDGARVINCTTSTALTCFERGELQECLLL